MVAPTVKFDGDRMVVHFNSFDPDSYRLFLGCKRLPEYGLTFHPEDETYTIDAPARFAYVLGVDPPKRPEDDLPFASFLYDDQTWLVGRALDSKRFAVWSGCGNGKTLIGLEWSRHVVKRSGGRVLIVTLNEIVPQWIDEAAKFYGGDVSVKRLHSRDEMREWCAGGEPGIAITNYEKFNPGELSEQVVNECRHLAGIVLDESSRLKGGGGKQKWALIKSCRGIEYKLSLTATPAPNDTIEFASQASFLEKMRTEADIIWTFFTRNPVTTKWEVKPHARQAFFEFMSSWSIYINDPKRYGWRQTLPDVPKPIYHEIDVPCTAEQRAWLQRLTADQKTGQMDLFGGGGGLGVTQRNKLSQVAKGFIYVKGSAGGDNADFAEIDEERTPATGAGKAERVNSHKPDAVRDIVLRESDAGNQVIVWTVFDEESTILVGLMEGRVSGGLGVITGKTSESDRIRILNDFRAGRVRVLISRASMLGYGMNLQMASAMVFSGWNDSFESFYQAVRRSYRHGQTERLRVYLPIVRELEGDVWENVQRKEAEFERSIAEQEECYIKAMKGGW